MPVQKASFESTLTNPLLWQPIAGYEGLYLISYNGMVYSFWGKRRLKPGLSGNGYLTVALYRNPADKKTHTIHTLVANAFVPNPANLPFVNHKNGNKLFNHYTNFEFTTPGGNIAHAKQTGLMGTRKALGCIQMDKDGNEIKRYRSTMDAEVDGFSSGNICSVCSGKRQFHGGYRWKYLNN